MDGFQNPCAKNACVKEHASTQSSRTSMNYFMVIERRCVVVGRVDGLGVS